MFVFDLLSPRARIADGSWVWTSNPFLTIRYASRSWNVSKPHCSFSLLTLVPFSPVKRKKICIHDASLLSEMVRWLAGIPRGIIHKVTSFVTPFNKRQKHKYPFYSPTLHFLVYTSLSVCFLQDCSHRRKLARTRCVRTAQGHRDRFCDRHVHNFMLFCDCFFPSQCLI